MAVTKVWTAQHGRVYLHVIVDCCTRELPAWTLDLHARAAEATGCVETGTIERTVRPGVLTRGTDTGSYPPRPLHLFLWRAPRDCSD